MIYDKMTGFPIGDPEEKIFPNVSKLTKEQKDCLLETSILSVSGWRRVFAIDGDEESKKTNIALSDKVLVGGAARIYADFLKTHVPQGKRPLVTVGLDSRPTGPQIASVIIRALIAYGCRVSYVFIASAPEIMAYTKNCEDIDGFMYVSGSHNPIGHNGLKFGVTDGAVLGKDAAKPLITAFKENLYDDGWVSELCVAIDTVSPTVVESVYNAVEYHKKGALRCYAEFTDEVVTGLRKGPEQKALLKKNIDNIKKVGVGVLAEFNGSARTVSIDKEYLKRSGIAVVFLNDKPRDIVHRIVPEGISLEPARKALEELAQSDSRYRFAYVPDCDGDRGNIVTLDENGKSWVLEAQEVFALSVVSELSFLVYVGKLTYNKDNKPNQKVAVVVNGPTSGRIELIAKAFGAEVFRAEVGEANVVSLALQKQKEGYLVRILGEGSNGGNITLPSTVRDPINTIFAFIKMLVLRSANGIPGLFEIWCKLSGNQKAFRQNVELYDVARTLPQYITTSAYEDRAMVKIKHKDHASLKRNYERIFMTEWEGKKTFLKEKLGIEKFEVINYEGTTVSIGMGDENRTGSQRGGFKIEFYDEYNEQCAFLWMRGSGTEPVFRVLVDVRGGDGKMEEALLRWHCDMLHKADR